MNGSIETVVIAADDELATITIGTTITDTEYEQELLVAAVDKGSIRVETERYTPRNGDEFGGNVGPSGVVGDGHSIPIDELEHLCRVGRFAVGDIDKAQVADHLLDF